MAAEDEPSASGGGRAAAEVIRAAQSEEPSPVAAAAAEAAPPPPAAAPPARLVKHLGHRATWEANRAAFNAWLDQTPEEALEPELEARRRRRLNHTRGGGSPDLRFASRFGLSFRVSVGSAYRPVRVSVSLP